MDEKIVIGVLFTLVATMLYRRLKKPTRSIKEAFLLLSVLVALVAVFLPHRFDAGNRRAKVAVFLIDLSRSMAPRAQPLLDPAHWDFDLASDADRYLVVGFGREAILIDDRLDRPNRPYPLPRADDPLFRSTADLRSAIATAAAALKNDEIATLTIVSDGGFTTDGVARAVLGTAIADVRIQARIATDDEDVAIRFISPPPLLAPRATIDLLLEVSGHLRAPRTIVVGCGRETREVFVTPETTQAMVSFRVSAETREGAFRAEIRSFGGPDVDRKNDFAELPYDVMKDRPTVLVASSDRAVRERMAAYLATAGSTDVRVVDALDASAMRGAATVIFAETPAENPQTMRSAADLLAAHASRGGGVLLIGSDHAFGRGGWANTPIDELSPLGARPGDASLDVTACLDRSGSMDEGGGARFDAARRAVRELYAGLFTGDTLRVLAFSSTIEEFSFQGKDNARALSDRLAKILPQGGTDLGACLDHAFDIERSPEKKSIMLVLSDGKTKRGDMTESRIDGWAVRARRQKIEVHVFWFDRDESLRPMLERLTQSTGGKLVPIDDFKTLVEAFLATSRPDLLVERPKVASVDGAEAVVSRLVRTKKKDGIDVRWSLDAETAVVAIGGRGLGRVAAMPIEPTEANLDAIFSRSSEFAAFLSELGRLDYGEGPLDLSIDATPEGFRLRADGGPLSKKVWATAEIDGRPIELGMVEPGVFSSAPLAVPPKKGPVVLIAADGDRVVRSVAAADLSDRAVLPSDRRLAEVADILRRAGVPTPAADQGLLALKLCAAAILLLDILLRIFRK